MKFFSFCFALTVCLVWAAPAFAHKAHLFATVQGGEIVADCRFSKKSPARNARVAVFEAETGTLLLSGRSDARGEARLPLTPELAAHPVALRVRLDAGEGHQAEWRIEAEELRDAVAGAAAHAPIPEATPVAAPPDNPQCIGPEELAARLRNQEARLRAGAAAQRAAELAERNARGPGLTEIIGGIGWIVGVFSLIVALKERRGRA